LFLCFLQTIFTGKQRIEVANTYADDLVLVGTVPCRDDRLLEVPFYRLPVNLTIDDDTIHVKNYSIHELSSDYLLRLKYIPGACYYEAADIVKQVLHVLTEFHALRYARP